MYNFRSFVSENTKTKQNKKIPKNFNATKGKMFQKILHFHRFIYVFVLLLCLFSSSHTLCKLDR